MAKKETKAECLQLQKEKPYYYWKAECDQNDVLKKRTGTTIQCYKAGMVGKPRPKQPFPDKKSCMGPSNKIRDTDGTMKNACKWVEGCFVNR